MDSPHGRCLHSYRCRLVATVPDRQGPGHQAQSSPRHKNTGGKRILKQSIGAGNPVY
jgi:hypothetical protein